MTTDRMPKPEGARLNPFVLPSETSAHFVLLIVSLCAYGLLLFVALSATAPSESQKQRHANATEDMQFLKAVEAHHPLPPKDFEEAAALSREENSCFNGERLRQARWMSLGTI